MKDWFKRNFLHSPIKYIIIAIVAIIIVLGNLFMNGFDYYIYYIDGVQVAALAIIFIGGLSFLGHCGAYDFWGYTISRKQAEGKKIEITDYLEQKKAKRRTKYLPYPPYFLSGIVLFVISLVMLLFK